ncbi:MAG: hypothetical protein U1E02_13290, partial [Hydrogenophaga sp.]|nr:hypothetical protein [Hydrogenophaga sp.]
KFLQFEGTDVRELARLRDALNAGEPFLGELLNRGKHGRDTIMAASLYGVSDNDLKALAHFLARVPP